MKKEEIGQDLKTWFSQMLEKYTWLSIKYEFSTKRNCFMVSFSPASIISQDDDFCIEALAFEDEMNVKYGDDAPLFCDDESLFKLSTNAQILSNPSVSNTYVYEASDLNDIDFSCGFINVPCNASMQEDWTEELQFDNTRKIAA